MADRIKNYQQEADQITTLKAIRTDLGVTPSSYTPDATVVTKDRVVTFAQAEEELVVLGDVERGVRNLTGDVNKNENDIANIKALLQGHLYDYQTDSTSAYTKSVPAGAMPYAGLEQIGGKTVVWNQLVDSGTTTVSTISGRKYYTLIDGTASIVTADGTAITIVDDTADMVCDLTLMFGSGNEPSTTADFTAIFGATHYSYNAGELLSAGVTEVVSKDGNNATLQTYSVPAEVQALEGYGWSAGTAYNYVDFERKVFVQNVGKLVLDGDNVPVVGGGGVGGSNNNYRYNTDIITPAYKFKNDNSNAVSAPLSYNFYNSVTGVASATVATVGFASTSQLYIVNIGGTITSKPAMNTWLQSNPITVYYELETPVETDISQYLTDDNLIQVESGGTLTFPNQNGTDYRIPVPSEEEYMIDLQASL